MERAISERDHKDSTRADSPLSTSSDSVVIDTSGRTIDDVVREITGIVAARRMSEER
jgi:cytidylate kinase